MAKWGYRYYLGLIFEKAKLERKTGVVIVFCFGSSRYTESDERFRGLCMPVFGGVKRVSLGF